MKLEIFNLQKSNFIMKVMDFEHSFLMDKVQRREYEQREKALRDYYSYMDESYEDGKIEGIQQGIQQGEQNKSREIALNLLDLGANMEMIVKATGLSENEIRNLQSTKE